VSDLYQETTEPPDATGESPGDDGYQETDAEVQARIASQDELPTPEESRAATWGDNPQYYDDADLAAEYDGDAGAFQSWEDDLPTPEESRAATWGNNPQYYDEAELATEYDGDLSALTAGSAGNEAGQEGTGKAAPGSGLASDAGAIADVRTDTEPGLADDAERPQEDSGEPSSAEARQISALEAERDQARQENADLKAENADLKAENADVKAQNATQAALIDRQTALIQQLLAHTGRYQDGETSTPDHGEDGPDGSREQDALLGERISTDQRADTKREEQTRWRRAASAENVGAVSTVLGAADIAMHGMPGVAVALGATAIGVASWGQAKIEKHRKGKP